MAQTPVLVVYASDTGHTREAAQWVATALDATLEEIKATGKDQVALAAIADDDRKVDVFVERLRHE